MIAKDSVNRACAADIYVDVSEIDVDVSGAAMASENAGGPTGIDLDVGVLHGDVQVSIHVLGS